VTSWLACLAVLAPVSSAQAARPSGYKADRARLGSVPFVKIHDSVHRDRLSPAAKVHAHKGYGGVYYTGDGTPVHVYLSSYYEPDDSVNQSWADFFGGIVHNGELRKLSVYLAPLGEVHRLCGSDSDSCYYRNEITLLDSDQSNTPIEDLAAHEYGHHIDGHRHNDIGYAGDWGPEYWATYYDVCDNAGTTMFPGNEGRHYEQNPDEGWAETNRALNGSIEPWDTVSKIFYPTNRSLSLARADIERPYDGGEYVDRHGRLGARRRAKSFRVPVQNDGNVDLKLRMHGSLRADIAIYSGGRRLDHARHHGRHAHHRGQYCGYRHLKVRIVRRSGHGSFKLRAILPFFSS
jgi:hypothetical protein